LSELEKTPDFRGKYLIMIGEDCHGGLSEIPYDQSGFLRTEIYRKCHVIESSNRNTIDFWLGRSDKITKEELMDYFGGCKPCMFFARGNSPFLQRVFPRHRWGIFMLT